MVVGSGAATTRTASRMPESPIEEAIEPQVGSPFEEFAKENAVPERFVVQCPKGQAFEFRSVKSSVDYDAIINEVKRIVRLRDGRLPRKLQAYVTEHTISPQTLAFAVWMSKISTGYYRFSAVGDDGVPQGVGAKFPAWDLLDWVRLANEFPSLFAMIRMNVDAQQAGFRNLGDALEVEGRGEG